MGFLQSGKIAELLKNFVHSECTKFICLPIIICRLFILCTKKLLSRAFGTNKKPSSKMLAVFYWQNYV